MARDLHCHTAVALSKACEVILHAALSNLSILDQPSGRDEKQKLAVLSKALIGIVSLLKQMMGSQVYLKVCTSCSMQPRFEFVVLNHQ